MDERLNFAPCGYISITQEGVITNVNQTFLDKMGYRREELMNKHLECIMTAANKLVFHSYFYPFINLNGQVEELFLSLKNSEGELVPHIINGRRYEQDGVVTIDCVLVQMGKRIEYERELRSAKKQIEEAYWVKNQALEKLEMIYAEIERKQQELMNINQVLMELSVTDKLTGLKNRRYLQDKLEEYLASFHKDQRIFSILLIDVDYFKQVNDTWGHQAGDEVLEQMASILLVHSRIEDIVARYGGEEFLVIMPDLDAKEAVAAAEQLRHAVEVFSWSSSRITISIGVATMSTEDTEASLLKKADQALYASKNNGRNQVTHSIDLQQKLP